MFHPRVVENSGAPQQCNMIAPNPKAPPLVWFIRKPNQSEIRDFIAAQGGNSYSYSAVGATQKATPARFDTNHNRVLLGSGDAVFAAACGAIRCWQMFPSDWIEIIPPDTPLQPGNNVAVLAHCLGAWWLNACRIVYVMDQQLPIRRFGFAYGTLTSHMQSGEELFVIEQDSEDRVWYEVRSFSRPGSWLTRLGYPLARRLQKRFVHDSGQAMQLAVRESMLPNGAAQR